MFENGRVLSPEDAKKKINRIIDQMRQNARIRALETVAEAENNEILTNALTYFKKTKYLSPKQAFVVLWRLKRHRIDHSLDSSRSTLCTTSSRLNQGKRNRAGYAYCGQH